MNGACAFIEGTPGSCLAPSTMCSHSEKTAIWSPEGALRTQPCWYPDLRHPAS